MTDFKSLKVVELKVELANRGLSTAGKKDELIERLEEYEFELAPQNPAVAETSILKETPIVSPAIKVAASPVITGPSSPISIPVQVDSPAEHSNIDDLALEEERKRQARAIRFGLNPDEIAKVNVVVAVQKLEHALPDRRFHHHRPHWRKHKHANKVSKP